MNARSQRAVWSALALLAFAALALSAPRLIEYRLHQYIAQTTSIEAHGLHVDPLWHIHVNRLTATHQGATLTCHNLRLETALWPIIAPRAHTPRLRHVDLPHCTLHIALDDANNDKRAKEPNNATPRPSIQDHINQTTDRLRKALRNTRTLALQQLDLSVEQPNNPIRASLHNVQWTQKADTQLLHTTISASEPLLAHAITTEIRWNDEHTSLRITQPTPINYQDWTIDFERAEMIDGNAIQVPHLRVFSRKTQREIADLTDVSLSLHSIPNLRVQRGTVHLPNLEFTHLLRNTPTPHTEDDPPPSPLHAHNAKHTHAQDVWSLRTLERARQSVRKLQKFTAIHTAQSPFYFDARNIDLQHEQNTLMQIETLQLQPDQPLTLDAQISHARVSLRADEDPPKRWTLSVQNAALQRIAAFVELEDHLRGHADAELQLTIENDTLLLTGTIAVHQAILEHAKVSDLPIGPLDLEGEIHAKIPADPEQNAELHSDVSLNTLPLTLELHALPLMDSNKNTHGDPVRFQARLALEKPTPCQDIWTAIPNGLLPDIGHAAIGFKGNMQPELTLDYTGGQYNTFTLRSKGVPGECSLRVLDPTWNPEALTHKEYVHHVQEGVTRDDIYVGPGTDAYVAIDTLPPYLPALMYLSEEIAFYDNHALSMGLINRGIRHSLPRKRFAYGGSTVTQQLVKNLYFSRTKQLVRKFQEAVIAWAMTHALEKDQILELYINCIEFGPNLYGIERAAQYYFDKPAAALSPLEAAWLASLKPSPRRGERDFQRGYSDHNNWNSQRIETLLRRLTQYTNILSADDVNALAPYVVFFEQSPNAGALPQGFSAHNTPNLTTDAQVEDTQ